MRRVEAEGGGREPGRHPLCDTLFVYQSGPQAGFFDRQTVAGFEYSRDYWYGDVCQLDIGMTMWRKAGCLGGTVEYNAALFDESTMRRMLDHVRLAVQAVTATDAQPDQPIGTLPILSEVRPPERCGW